MTSRTTIDSFFLDLFAIYVGPLWNTTTTYVLLKKKDYSKVRPSVRVSSTKKVFCGGRLLVVVVVVVELVVVELVRCTH